MLPKKRLAAAGAAVVTVAAYLTLQPCPAKADDQGTALGDIAISEIAATPARAGQTTMVTFLVENSGSDRLLITGLRMPGGEPSRIMGSFGQGHSGEIGALPVSSGVTERLDGKKVWIEVGPLAQDLDPEAAVPARLILGTYEAPLTLHVGPIATGSAGSTSLGPTKIANQSAAETHHGAGC